MTRISDDAGQAIGFLKVIRDASEPLRALDERDRLLESERAARAEAERQAAALTAAIEAIPDGVYIGDADGIIRCNKRRARDARRRLDRRPAGARRRAGAPVPASAATATATSSSRRRCRTRAPCVARPPCSTPGRRGRPARTSSSAARRRRSSSTTAIVGVVAVNSDLTDRLRLEEKQHQLNYVETELRERDEQLRAVFAGVRDYAIFTVGVDGRISSWHEGAEIMKRYTAEEAIGMPFANLFTEENRACGQPEREMEIAARTGEYKGEGQRVRSDGEIFEAAVVLTALRGPRGELLGYLKLTQDITDRRRQERSARSC